MTKSLREISQALLDNWDTVEWNKLSKRAELMAELRAALVDPTTVTRTGRSEEDQKLIDRLRSLVDNQTGGDALVLVQRQLFNKVVGRLSSLSDLEKGGE